MPLHSIFDKIQNSQHNNENWTNDNVYAQNEFTIKDYFTFADEIVTQNSDLYMDSLDVDALFTKITLDETIDISVKKLFKTLDTLVKEIFKNDFRVY